jgi:Glycosyltransferase family 10 (fucosyltransferase) C-term
MVAIKRPSKRKHFTGCNILISVLSIHILFALFFFARSGSKGQEPGVPTLQDHLGESVKNLRKPISRVADSVESEDNNSQDSLNNGNIPLEEIQDAIGGGSESDRKDSPIDGLSHGKEDGEQVVGGRSETANYYIADYSYERENPGFRHQSVSDWDTSHDIVNSQIHSKQIRSCQYKSDTHSILFHDSCRKSGTKLIAYNSAPFARFWCGVLIAPGKAMEIPSYCSESPRLFPMDSPPINGKGMPPMNISSSLNFSSSSSMKNIECDIPCQHEEATDGIERYIQGTNWKVIQTMNDPTKHSEAQVERTSFRHDLYYSTTSFKSSVPLSFFSFEKYDIFSPAVDFDLVDPSASYLVNSKCAAQATKRNRWESAVREQYIVKSYGNCDHNTDLPDGMKLFLEKDRITLLKKHRLNLALDDCDAKDHITPMIWEAMSSGTLPIILGAQNVKEHFPPESFISVGGLQKWADLGALVAKVAVNKTEWANYHAWRTNTAYKQMFVEKYNFTRVQPECRLCRWAYAKYFGLGWSHKQQIVQDPYISRTLCIDDTTNMISMPFQESWHLVGTETSTDLSSGGKAYSCLEGEHQPTLEVTLKSLKLTRNVVTHDNVIDLHFSKFEKEALGSDLVIRLDLPIFNPEGAYFPNPHVLVQTERAAAASSIAVQDSKSKITLLASWHTAISVKVNGTVEILIRHGNEEMQHDLDEIRRLRVIIEDMSELSDKRTEYFPSSFAKMHIKDFVDPLELFFIET